MRGMREKQFLGNFTHVVNRTNHSDCSFVKDVCLETTGLTICMFIVCIVGVVSNILLLFADYKEWKKRKTPDKVLICNITIVNIATLLMNLLEQALQLSQSSEVVLCSRSLRPGLTVKTNSLIICTLVSVTTLGLLGVDRLDALTKFAHQRKLTVQKAIVASVVVWLCSFLILPLSMLPINIPILVSSWIFISCIFIVTSMLIATRRIRKHRQEIMQMFGARNARAEIKFTKTLVALCFCYAVFMLPHVIATFGAAGVINDNRTFKCVLSLFTKILNLSFALLPFVYFAMDLKMMSSVLPKLAASLSTSDSKVRAIDDKGVVTRATESSNLSRNTVALQVVE